MLMKLHTDRRRLLHELENATLDGARTEDIVIALSENRGETRAYLRFLGDEVVTRPGKLDPSDPDSTMRATLDELEETVAGGRAL